MEEKTKKRIENSITGDMKNAKVEIDREIIPGELYSGARRFLGNSGKKVIIETARYDSDKQQERALGNIKTKNEAAQQLSNVTLNSQYTDHSDPEIHYFDSHSSGITLRDILDGCDLSTEERGHVALKVLRMIKDMHSSKTRHNGLSLERILSDPNRVNPSDKRSSEQDIIFRILTNYPDIIQDSVRRYVPEELIGSNKDLTGKERDSRYDEYSLDRFLAALIGYEILIGEKPRQSKEYKLSAEEFREFKDEVNKSPESLPACFDDLKSVKFSRDHTKGYLKEIFSLFSAVTKSLRSLGMYISDKARPNRVADEFSRVLDKRTMEKCYGSEESFGARLIDERRHWRAVGLSHDNADDYFNSRGDLNYKKVLDLGLIKIARTKRKDEIKQCPDIDQLIDSLKIFDKKKYAKSVSRKINEKFGEIDGKEEVIDIKIGQIRKSKRRFKQKVAAAVGIAAVAFYSAGNYIVPQAKKQSVINASVSYVGEKAKVLNSALSQLFPGEKEDASIIRTDSTNSYVVMKKDAARIRLDDLEFAYSDNSDPSDIIVKGGDSTFILVYEGRSLITREEDTEVRPGAYNIEIIAVGPESDTLKTGIELKIVGVEEKAKLASKAKKKKVEDKEVEKKPIVNEYGKILRTAGRPFSEVVRETKWRGMAKVYVNYGGVIYGLEKRGDGHYYNEGKIARNGVHYGWKGNIVDGAFTQQVCGWTYELKNVGQDPLGDVWFQTRGQIKDLFREIWVYDKSRRQIRKAEYWNKDNQSDGGIWKVNGRYYEDLFFGKDEYVGVSDGDIISTRKDKLIECLSRKGLKF